MRKYLYLIKKKKIKSWLKFWLLTNNKFNSILSSIIEGTSFNLQNTVKRYFKIFNIFGNSVQDEIPSPDYPSEIHSVADDVNLFDASKIANSSISVTDNGKTIKLPIASSGNGNVNTSAFLKDLCPKLNVGDVVYLNFTRNINPGKNNFIFLYNNTMSPTAVEWDNGTSKTIDQNLLDSYVILYGNKAQDGETQQIILTDFKIQKNKATPYSPYNYGTFTIDFEGQTENYNYTFITEPLRSLPNGVRDTIEEDGIHRRVGRVVLDGTENWTITTNLHDGFVRYYISGYNIGSTSALSDYFLVKDTTSTSTENILECRTNSAILINTNVATTLEDFKTWLSTHNTEVLYELAEEIIEPYTEEQQEQYNKIKELYTFNGTTNISSDDEVPPYLQIQYYMKGE